MRIVGQAVGAGELRQMNARRLRGFTQISDGIIVIHTCSIQQQDPASNE